MAQARQIEGLAKDHRGAAETYSIAAEIYAKLGDNDRAFAALEQAYAEHDPGLPWVNVDLFLRSLHGDPRWTELLHRAGLAGDQWN